MMLDLACGQSVHPGYVGVDIWPGADIQHDLSVFPWPWDDSTIEQAICLHYVEHVVDLIGFMNELWRIMRPGGEVLIQHPYAHSNRAWQDPTHVRALNEDSWRYYNAEERKLLGVDHYPIVANFELGRIDFVVSPLVKNPSMNDIRHKLNVCDDLRVELRAIK